MNANEEELKSPSGVILTLDTTNLEQNFLIGNQGSEEGSDFGSEDE